MYLNCHTYFSLRYGTFSEEELIKLTLEKGFNSVAITDINNTSASLSFIRQASSYNINPVVGIDFRSGVKQLYVALAKNNQGFEEINSFMSYHNMNKLDLPDKAHEFQNSLVIYPFRRVSEIDITKLKSYEYIGVSVSDLNKFRMFPYHKFQSKIVLLHTVSFRNKRDFNAHRLLRAIDNNTILSKLSKFEEASPDSMMYSMNELMKIFRDYPFVLNNTSRLIEECSIKFDFSANRKSKNLKSYTGNRNDDLERLKQLCDEGISRRYSGRADKKIIDRLNNEIDVIQKMDFVSYFLINWDIISYANRMEYYHVGRGSGANSIVAYLLGITDVDPVDLDLYFERFINLFRSSPPDFDIDFSWRDRDDVTKYIFDRFSNTALLCTYNTFQYRGVVRELGKVFGLPKHEIDKINSKSFSKSDADELSQLVLKYASLIKGIPNHLGIHAGGILISEQNINCYCSTHLPPKGFETTDFDMVTAEDIGLYKFDILGQRGLAKIKEAINVVRYNQPEKSDFDIYDVERFKNDEKVNSLVKRAKCLGCFYVESPGMRSLLQKLETDNYLGLVAASSVIRPGVASSGMMREYILRHRDPERAKARAHKIMLELMPETYGVMVYQEDVIKVAHYFAGLTLSESDVIRRGMAGKYRCREEFLKVKDKFLSNCLKRGYEKSTIIEIWRQIESFAGYSFAKGHSASYAVESYQSLFLKAYFPLEFMVAVINNGGGFFRTEVYVNEVRLLGGEIEPPCINKSFRNTVIYGKTIYLGLLMIKGLEINIAKQIEKERDVNGEFKSFDDFLDRINIGIEQISALIRIDAFRFTGISKRKLLWQAFLRVGKTPSDAVQKRLFKNNNRKFDLPDLPNSIYEDAFDQIELIDFPLINPFRLLKDKPESTIAEVHLSQFENRRVIILGYLVTVKYTQTVNSQTMSFGTFFDYRGEFFDTVHFPSELKRFPFRGIGVYSVVGKVVSEFGVYSVEVESMEKKAYMEDPRYAIEEKRCF